MQHDRPARALHWITAVAVLATIPVGLVMVREGLPRPLQDTLFIFHKNIGVAILLVMVARVIWRSLRDTPPSPPLPRWQARAAALNHATLYILLLVMPISGYVRVRAGGFPIEALDPLGLPGLVPRSEALADIAASVHFYTSWALITAILLHIAAAFRHMLARDGIIQRIWPPI